MMLLISLVIIVTSLINLWMSADPYMRENIRINWSKYEKYINAFYVIVAIITVAYMFVSYSN